MPTRAVQRESTVAAFVTEARALFARDGYAAVTPAQIVTSVGMTKGALYHHFGSKLGLFRAVVEQVQRDVAGRVSAAAAEHADPWDQLVAGCEAFISAGADQEVQRIMLVDAPAVLGWAEWRAMDESSSGRLLVQVLTALVEEGTLEPQPVEPLARLLSGAMNEAALWLAEEGGAEDLPVMTAALRRLLAPLRVSCAPGAADGGPTR